MIPLTAAVCQADCPTEDTPAPSPGWQQLLAQAISSPAELLTAVGLTAAQIPGGICLDTPFPQRVPRGYVSRMRHGDPHDPLLLQMLPRQQETVLQAGFGEDPVGDNAAAAIPGLLHKYAGRVLLITTSACPVHCRYCFRRHFPYTENRPEDRHWQHVANYIAARPEITEVILSGGDPLSLSTERLTEITQSLLAIPHLQRLRIHTRMPIVLPERVDAGFLHWLGGLPWQTVLVTHCNHANEISPAVQQSLSDIRQCDTTLLNQAVLLKGVNDSVDALTQLSEGLFAAGVLPYYLHLLDRVQGAGHFDVDAATALSLVELVRQQLPGFLVPQLVREVAGKPYKIPVDSFSMKF